MELQTNGIISIRASYLSALLKGRAFVDPCADPESFVRAGPTQTTFLLLLFF